MSAHLSRRFAVLALSTLVAGAWAQDYPAKPLILIVPFAPGASADLLARVVGRELSEELKQPVIVENKPGAGGALGLIALSKMRPDGYAIGMGATGAIAINPHLPDAPPLNPQKELLTVAKLADIPLVVVASNNSGFTNLNAYLKAAAPAGPGQTFGTAGQYTAQHLAGELLANFTNTRLTAVSYKGSGPAVMDLIGGNLPVAVVDLTSAYPHIKAGKMVALGVTSAQRSKVAPEIPTIEQEGVKGYAAPAWMGLFLPGKAPVEVQQKLSFALEKILAKPAVQQQLIALAAEPAYLNAKDFDQFVRAESGKWAQVIVKITGAQK